MSCEVGDVLRSEFLQRSSPFLLSPRNRLDQAELVQFARPDAAVV